MPPWKKGEPSPNPSGHPKGQRNYATIRKIAFERIGQARGMSAEEVEEAMVQGGLLQSMKGQYRFYQDDLDRAYGKPKQGLEHTGADGGAIEFVKKEL